MTDQQEPTEEKILNESVEPSVEPSKEELIENELQECKDKYIRLLAESENTRKRLQKDKQDSIRFALDNLIAEFLAPMDNLENALHFSEQASEETANWAKGFHMILEQFKDVLSNNGVSSFASTGQMFDPYHHEAVETETSDSHKEGFIIQEYIKGYKSKDRIIRPARVKVTKKPAHQAEPLSVNNQETTEKE